MSNKTQPKPRVVHLMSSRHPDKGRCGKRGNRTKIMAIVTCRDCRPTLPESTPASALAAMRMLAGVSK